MVRAHDLSYCTGMGEADDPPSRDLRRPSRDDRDQRNLADDRLIPGELGRRPTMITVNAQTKVSKVNPSLKN